MQGAVRSYLETAIKALVLADKHLMKTSVNEALRITPYGKSDTQGFDAIPEIQIKDTIQHFDSQAILVTEELGVDLHSCWPRTISPETNHPVIFFCDPTDRSAFFKKYLESLKGLDRNIQIGEVVRDSKFIRKWVGLANGPASITGATSSITCIMKGSVIFSVIINYITQEIIVACTGGIRRLQLPHYQKLEAKDIYLDKILDRGEEIIFQPFKSTHPYDRFKFFVTFLGKTGYQENFIESKIFATDADQFLRYNQPGGPSRVLYLSSLQPKNKPIGFILANGEKISECIHWLPFVRFARHHGEPALQTFEIAIERPFTKDGILMSTSPPYSIFRKDESGQMWIDVSLLRTFTNPSKYRLTLVITPYKNEWVKHVMEQFNYREIKL